MLQSRLVSLITSDFSHPSLQVICSYLFMPFAFLMGVDWADCNTVGRFLGVKTFLNEFVAYLEMGPYIKNRQEMNGGPTISVSKIITNLNNTI